MAFESYATAAGDDDRYADRYGESTRPQPAFPWHPLAAAPFLPLMIYAVDPASVDLWDAVPVLIVAVALAAALLYGAAQLLQSWTRGALIATWLIAMVIGYGLPRMLQTVSGMPIPDTVLAGSWGLFAFVGVFYWAQPREDEAQMTLLGNVIAGVMLLAPAAALVWHGIQSPAALIPSNPTGEVVSMEVGSHSATAPPDVYFLALDDYGTREGIAAAWRLDNAAFEAQLRRRGFHIGPATPAPFDSTLETLAASYNFGQTNPGEHSAYYRKQLFDHAAGRFFRQQGYRYFHFGAHRDGLRQDRWANVSWPQTIVANDYIQDVLGWTILEPLFRQQAPALNTLEQFKRLERIGREPGPKLVTAFFDLPGPPWRFDAHGLIRSDRDGGPTDAFEGQLSYTNTQLLRTIDAILGQSSRRPLIVIQATRPAENLDRAFPEQGLFLAVLPPEGRTLTRPPESGQALRWIAETEFAARIRTPHVELAAGNP